MSIASLIDSGSSRAFCTSNYIQDYGVSVDSFNIVTHTITDGRMAEHRYTVPGTSRGLPGFLNSNRNILSFNMVIPAAATVRMTDAFGTDKDFQLTQRQEMLLTRNWVCMYGNQAIFGAKNARDRLPPDVAENFLDTYSFDRGRKNRDFVPQYIVTPAGYVLETAESDFVIFNLEGTNKVMNWTKGRLAELWRKEYGVYR